MEKVIKKIELTELKKTKQVIEIKKLRKY